MLQWIHNFILILICIFIFFIFNFILYIILFIDKYTSNILDLNLPEYITIPFICVYTIIKYISTIIFWYLFPFLIYIFIAWEIIKHIVPEKIVIFVLFVPTKIKLRKLILDHIPPFKDLTEAGVLPFMEKILNIFIDSQSFSNKFKSIGVAFSNFFITFFNGVSKKLFPFNALTDYKKFIIIKENFIDSNDSNTETAITIANSIKSSTNNNIYKYNIPNDADNYYNNALKIINNNKENCIIGNTIEINSGMSIIEKTISNIKNKSAISICNNNAIQNIVELNLTMK